MRWGDMDAQGHVNNASFLDYLQEARVDFLLSGPQVMHDLLESGVLVVSHQVEYLAPIRAGDQPLTINLWVDAVGGSKFAIGYDLLDGDLLAGRARTALVPFDLARDSLRRLTPAEREVLLRHLAPAEPLRSLPRVRWTDGDHRFPFTVRWSDLDSYGHVNNVKFFDYVQEARIDMIRRTVGWSAEDVWLVARQDLEYLRAARLPPRALRGRHGGRRGRPALDHPGGGGPGAGVRHRVRDRAHGGRRGSAADRRPA